MTEPDDEAADTWREQTDFTAKRLNRLASALKARSYLEIGVESGVTFERVRVPQRTAVDPEFLFDTVEQASPQTQFAEVTSDRFFAGLPAATQYDLIFIDGLHLFEQAYRDLCNSLLHSHPRSVLLLDDTFPSDVYSTLRDPEQTEAFREAAGVDSTAWHGDTYKVVYAVHDFHTGLDYRTIEGPGNPQTLLWRSPTKRRAALGSLELISRLTYFDLINRLEVLQLCDEETAITQCLRSLGVMPRATRPPVLPRTDARRPKARSQE